MLLNLCSSHNIIKIENVAIKGRGGNDVQHNNWKEKYQGNGLQFKKTAARGTRKPVVALWNVLCSLRLFTVEKIYWMKRGCVTTSNQLRLLRNCPPTPSLTQHFAHFCEKLISTLGYGRGRHIKFCNHNTAKLIVLQHTMFFLSEIWMLCFVSSAFHTK